MSWVAWLFPGQGVQCLNMGLAAAKEFPESKAIFEAADDLLKRPLSKLIAEGPEEELMRTTNAQPAILTASYALALPLLKRLPRPPDWLAGHSLGEYTALVLSQALTFADALKIVQMRSLFMEEASPKGTGGMTAVIGLSRRKLSVVCKEISKENYIVEIANCNAAEQIVIGGHTAAVAEAGQKALEVGARRLIPLPVAGPFHTSIMHPAKEKLTCFLKGIRVNYATIPVISNVTGKPMRGARIIKQYLSSQVSSPVLWEQGIRYLLQRNVRCFVEMGPRPVLLPLVLRMDKEVTAYPVHDPETLLKTAENLYEPMLQDIEMDKTIKHIKDGRKRQEVINSALFASALMASTTIFDINKKIGKELKLPQDYTDSKKLKKVKQMAQRRRDLAVLRKEKEERREKHLEAERLSALAKKNKKDFIDKLCDGNEE